MNRRSFFGLLAALPFVGRLLRKPQGFQPDVLIDAREAGEWTPATTKLSPWYMSRVGDPSDWDIMPLSPWCAVDEKRLSAWLVERDRRMWGDHA